MKTKANLTTVEFWGNLLARWTRRPRLEDGDTAYPFGSAPSNSGSYVTTDSALKQMAAWACITLRARVIASLPLHVKNANKTMATGHPLFDLLHLQPNADMSISDYLKASSAGLDCWGNGYSRIAWSDNRSKVVALTPLNSEKMEVKRGTSGAMLYTYRNARNEPEPIDERDVLHFKGFTMDGLIGLSPIQYAAETLGGMSAANEAAAHEFRNGMKAGGFLGLPAGVALDKDQRARYRDLLAMFGRPENAGKFLLLEHGITLTGGDKIRFNPVDSQLLESRFFGIEETCRAFGVPPPLIGHTDKASSWASSLENLNQGFLTYGLRPTLIDMEQTIKRKLVPRAEWKTVNIGFNIRSLLRGNFSQQMNAYVQGANNGIYCLDEIRDFEDMPALPDGDGQQFRVPMNTEPAGTTPEERNASKPQVPAPADPNVLPEDDPKNRPTRPVRLVGN
jgi:HK97 family phage portal protein